MQIWNMEISFLLSLSYPVLKCHTAVWAPPSSGCDSLLGSSSLLPVGSSAPPPADHRHTPALTLQAASVQFQHHPYSTVTTRADSKGEEGTESRLWFYFLMCFMWLAASDFTLGKPLWQKWPNSSQFQLLLHREVGWICEKVSCEWTCMQCCLLIPSKIHAAQQQSALKASSSHLTDFFMVFRA